MTESLTVFETEATKRKISQVMKGRIFSAEHCRNLSLAMKGNKNGTQK